MQYDNLKLTCIPVTKTQQYEASLLPDKSNSTYTSQHSKWNWQKQIYRSDIEVELIRETQIQQFNNLVQSVRRIPPAFIFVPPLPLIRESSFILKWMRSVAFLCTTLFHSSTSYDGVNVPKSEHFFFTRDVPDDGVNVRKTEQFFFTGDVPNSGVRVACREKTILMASKWTDIFQERQ